MPSVGFLDVYQKCFPLPQKRIPLCFSTPNRFRVMTVLNERRERIACSNGRGKEGGFQKQIMCGSNETETAGRAKGEDEDEGE
ncbi:uncharacterized protein MONOS_4621 [Monocercomonoides exilis]|uniref:uncharacterized protein n=1 Tax=Monocercomonoides exilis TaxID=2049356 RepID=UPI00355AAE55|nr:hypothetical protein MONOS_4621 [Monocercomonoides exilis]|eukprot:MONOS_4621.1-p1 / transcript=MONOS_4621.1 / gene=MONOS_4621 / organism=Monocercomonoides_exilis_PA203 / gene_product=unspecified product / transcript_product=unspecified product / location=Mono_scaffold00124:112073-112398(-) / protein_length=83 / sequence_SO=supercontig / SO=protein_coding / is_pseudo=false